MNTNQKHPLKIMKQNYSAILVSTDTIWIDKQMKKNTIIDIIFPADRNIAKNEREKITKKHLFKWSQRECRRLKLLSFPLLLGVLDRLPTTLENPQIHHSRRRLFCSVLVMFSFSFVCFVCVWLKTIQLTARCVLTSFPFLCQNKFVL